MGITRWFRREIEQEQLGEGLILQSMYLRSFLDVVVLHFSLQGSRNGVVPLFVKDPASGTAASHARFGAFKVMIQHQSTL